MKIGLYAGTFDPIHNGHINFARQAISSGGLDKVIVVAEKKPYRKKPFASWDHRQAMIERATKDINEVDHDYAFASKLSHEHTMKDMLLAAEQHYGHEHEFWFLVGSDVFEHFHKWHDLVDQAEYGGFIVALRDDHTKQWLADHTKPVTEDDRVLQKIILDSPNPHISSSKIRQSIVDGTITEDVNTDLLNYIKSHNLYS